MVHARMCTVPLKSKLPAWPHSTGMQLAFAHEKRHDWYKLTVVLSGTVTQPKDWASTLSSLL